MFLHYHQLENFFDILKFLFIVGPAPACKDFSTFILHHDPTKFITVG